MFAAQRLDTSASRRAPLKNSNMYNSNAAPMVSKSQMKPREGHIDRAVDSMFAAYGRPKTGGSRPVTGKSVVSLQKKGGKSFTQAPSLNEALGRVKLQDNPSLRGGSVKAALAFSSHGQNGKQVRSQVLKEQKERIKAAVRSNKHIVVATSNPFAKTSETIFNVAAPQTSGGGAGASMDWMRTTSKLAHHGFAPNTYQRVLLKHKENPNPLLYIPELGEQGPMYRTSANRDFPLYDTSHYASKARATNEDFYKSDIIPPDNKNGESTFYRRTNEEYQERPEHHEALLAKHDEIRERVKNPPCVKHMRPTFESFEAQSAANVSDWATENRTQFYPKDKGSDQSKWAGARLANKGKFLFSNGGDGTGMDPSMHHKRTIYSSSALRSSLMLHDEDYNNTQVPDMDKTRFQTTNQHQFPVYKAVTYSHAAQRVVRPPTPHIALPEDRHFLSTQACEFIPQYDSDDEQQQRNQKTNNPSLPEVQRSPQQIEMQKRAEAEMDRHLKQLQKDMVKDFERTNSFYLQADGAGAASKSRPVTQQNGTDVPRISTGSSRPATSLLSSRPTSTISMPGSRSGRCPNVSDRPYVSSKLNQRYLNRLVQ